MKVSREPLLQHTFLIGLRKKYDEPRSEVHVSDLTWCLRQSFFRRVNPKPLTLKSLQYMSDGARRHNAVQEALDVECEVEVERFGIVGHIDVLLDAPLEFKSTRAVSALPEHYFKQLGFYAVLKRSNYAYLVVQRVNCVDGQDPWEFYRVEWNDDELLRIEDELKLKSRLLREAFVFHDPSKLPKIDDSTSWKCKSCLYRDECSQI